MEHNIFETRQKSQELMEQAIKMWQMSPQSEKLEGLEKDPVFSLIMSAVAYQANETDSEIERLKSEVLNEFVKMLTPYEMGHAIPATAVIETALQPDVPEWDVDSDTVFRLGNSQCTFMPLLRSKVINSHVRSIVRIDGRHWKVTLDFSQLEGDLSGFTFAIKNSYFKDVKISYNQVNLPILRPWDYSELPLTKCFAIDCALYNNSQYFNPSMIAMELFARQNIRLFSIKEHDSSKYMDSEVESIDLIFEFTGISDNFVFNKDNLSINCIPLAEVHLNEVSLSSSSPIARLSGYRDTNSNEGSSQFLHLLRPDEDLIYNSLRVIIRRVAADRFNQGSLLRLLNALISKYHSDFYAFQNSAELASDNNIHSLQDILQNMIEGCRQNSPQNKSGVYVLLHNEDRLNNKEISLTIPYLTTYGAGINNLLSEDSVFTPPAGFLNGECRQITAPVLGSDEISDKNCENNLLRYLIVTNDRIVTPADIRLFCYTELQTRYGIDKSLVKKMEVSHQLQTDSLSCGYEILAEITLKSNTFISRSFKEKIPQVEVLMQKMMEVRSTNIYPIRVCIKLEDQ